MELRLYCVEKILIDLHIQNIYKKYFTKLAVADRTGYTSNYYGKIIKSRYLFSTLPQTKY